MGEIRPDNIDMEDDPELTHWLQNLTDDEKQKLVAVLDGDMPEGSIHDKNVDE